MSTKCYFLSRRNMTLTSALTGIIFLTVFFQNCSGGMSSIDSSLTAPTSAETSPSSTTAPPQDQQTPVDVTTAKPAPSMDDGSVYVWPPAFKTLSSSSCAGPLIGSNRTYDVGPGKQYTELTQVPWLSLTAGDVVNIYYRAQPYKTIIGLRAQGTANRPVYINGVTDSQCNRPVIDANGAVLADDTKAVTLVVTV